MKNYISLKRLVDELNRNLGIMDDMQRDNIIQYYYNRGLISYMQLYLLHTSVLKHEYIYMIHLYKCIVRIGR